VISILNAYFVPAYAAWGQGNAGEQAEFKKIYDKMVAAGGQGGTVAVDVLTPDLKPLKMLHVVPASRPGVLLQTLQTVVSSLSLKPGEALVKPRRQSLPRGAGPDDLVLHLTARRFAEEEQLPGQFPGESWIVYKASEFSQILGGTEPAAGSEWEIAPELAKRLLIHVYPQEISSDHPEFNQIVEQRLTAKIISVEGGIARARMDGRLIMDRAHTAPRAVSKRIEATLAGYLDFEIRKRRVLAFKLATSKATADGRDFLVGVTSQPRAYTEPVE
jgi:hypothetical protein